MKYFLRYSLILITFLLAGFSCEKCNDLEILESTATISWSGDYALDGCGYSIQLGEKSYKPENEEDIDPSFKSHESASVRLQYVSLGSRKFQCGMLPAGTTMDFIRIISIEKI